MENETVKNINDLKTQLNDDNDSIKFKSLLSGSAAILAGTLFPVVGIPLALVGLGWTASFLVNKMNNEELSKTIEEVSRRIVRDKELKVKVDNVLENSAPKNLNKELSELLAETSK